MNFIQYSSLFLILPLLYEIRKGYRKMELNMFDFLLMFNCLHFGITPFLNAGNSPYSELISLKVFLILFIYELVIFALSIWWNKHNANKDCIINITRFIRKTKYIYISRTGYIVLLLFFILILVVYMPYATVITRMDSAGQAINDSYALKTILAILSSALSVVFIIISLRIVLQVRNRNLKKIDIIMIAITIIICAFFPRRYFLGNIIFFAIIFYSICRDKLNLRFIIILSLIAIFVFQVYFPFYNIVRHNPIRLDQNAPIQSLCEIVQYGIEHQSDYEQQKESTKERALNLYDAIYKLQKSENSIQYGQLIMAEIDIAIPSFLNSNKGSGSEGKLEAITGQYHDIADSVLLEACGDFDIVGSVIAPLLFLLTFQLYNLYYKFLNNITKQKIISFFILFALYSICWNVEGKFGSFLSWFFSSLAWIVILLISSHYKIFLIK
jgi:hypothetical protein